MSTFWRLWALAGALMSLASVAQASICETVDFEPCIDPTDRSLLFVVDGSNSIDRERFYREMLDFTQILYCTLGHSTRSDSGFVPTQHQVGMIVFNNRVTVQSQLDRYTPTEWFAEVERIRATKDDFSEENTVCCSCCTPMAEAFLKADEEFRLRAINDLRIAFTITDAVPSNNHADRPGDGNPEWLYPQYNPSVYLTRAVPQSANILKNNGARIFLVGVPNVRGVPPRKDYFNGNFRNRRKYCVWRDAKRFCSRYYKPPFPIASNPASRNVFSTGSWNVPGLARTVTNEFCTIPPSKAPTPRPTFEPTDSPSISTPSVDPTARPTQVPITSVPSERPSSRPGFSQPSASPVVSTPSERPSTSPETSNPSFMPTLSPTLEPTLEIAPFERVLDQTDITFILDRSKSMLWRQKECEEILAPLEKWDDSGIESQSACWDVMLRYVLAQADSMAKFQKAPLTPFDDGVNSTFGWADDYNITQDTVGPAAGIRVRLIAFACQKSQTVPKVFDYTEQYVDGGIITNRAQLVQMLQFLRHITPNHGTCPSAAIAQAIIQIEKSDQALYPLQAAILVTDGVFYDMPDPAKMVEGLRAYGVLRFAIGIAVADDNNQHGLTNGEIQIQKQQLAAFVGENSKFNYDLATTGWAGLLSDIVDKLASELPRYYTQVIPLKRGAWCGFKSRAQCSRNNWHDRNCRWRANQGGNYNCQRRPGIQIYDDSSF